MAKTKDNRYFSCVVDRSHAFKPTDDPRKAAQSNCVKALDAMVSGAFQ